MHIFKYAMGAFSSNSLELQCILSKQFMVAKPYFETCAINTLAVLKVSDLMEILPTSIDVFVL